jgi:AraC-like DNA-binding protein
MGDVAATYNRTGTASAAVLRPMLGYAVTRGVDTAAVLRAIDLPRPALDDFDRRIPEASRVRAWLDVSAATRDPAFGLLNAEHAEIGAYDVLDYAFEASETLEDALARFCRFHRVLCDAFALDRTVAGGVTRYRRVERTPPREAEGFFAFLVVRARALAGKSFAPREVLFAHPAPEKTAPHTKFFNAPVHFDAGATELLVATRDLSLTSHHPNPGLANVLERYMREIVARLPKDDSLIERARGTIAEQMRKSCGTRPSLEVTSKELHMSPRSVQRRLREHGTTHQDLVESVRRDMAERLVLDRRLSITEIAFLLGFEDVSGFRRAYERWTGTTPARARGRSRSVAPPAP